MFQNSEIIAQVPVSFCGTYTKTNNPTVSTTGQEKLRYFTDRFGNIYNNEEITVHSNVGLSIPSNNHCDANPIFRLDIDPAFDIDEQETIRCTFEYLASVSGIN